MDGAGAATRRAAQETSGLLVGVLAKALKVLWNVCVYSRMSLKLFVLNRAKPLAAAVTVIAAAYGTKEWQRAKDALQKPSGNYEPDMMKLFDRIDTDQSGWIDSDELSSALDRVGVQVSRLSLESMARCADDILDGKISRAEWMHIGHRLSKENGITPSLAFHGERGNMVSSNESTRKV